MYLLLFFRYLLAQYLNMVNVLYEFEKSEFYHSLLIDYLLREAIKSSTICMYFNVSYIFIEAVLLSV